MIWKSQLKCWIYCFLLFLLKHILNWGFKHVFVQHYLLLTLISFSAYKNWACVLHKDVYMWCLLFVNKLFETDVLTISESALLFSNFLQKQGSLWRDAMLSANVVYHFKFDYAQPCVNRENVLTLFFFKHCTWKIMSSHLQFSQTQSAVWI